MTEKTLEQMRKERGAQLRALVVSWDESRPYDDVLREQQAQIDAGTFAPSEEWSVAADEILGFYMSRPRLTAWDKNDVGAMEDQKKDDGPKLVIP